MGAISKNPKSFHIYDQDLSQEANEYFSTARELAVDTETMGLIHGRDRLCLVQICDSKDHVACIKVKIGQNSAPRLKSLLEDRAIEKIFHFARFDLSALYSGLKIEVNPIYCTKIASKIARTYTPRHGLKDLIMELTGVELDKKVQSSDWGKVEGLTNQQLVYAANDVRYLIQAKAILTNMLIRENRLDIANDCFKCVPTLSKLDRLRFLQVFDH